ncbi:MAG: helicase-associated domain-containing protein, partial [Gemmataceae bacterium]|nr:helicase-associated domain-containing protein [Gemmataceae bacterium]
QPERVRALYDQLDETGKAAVQEASRDPEGLLELDRFAPKYGRSPNFGKLQGGYRDPARPTILRLFFPQPYAHVLPSDLKDLLATMVPDPPPVTVTAQEELPPTVPLSRYSWKSGKGVEEQEEVPLRVRETARDALHDLKGMLRLVDAGQVRVSDKTRRPTPAAVKAVAALLHGGDFYTPEDETEYEYDSSSDLTMKAFAWPLILQAAGLAQRTGTKLQLSPAGRKATGKPAHEVLRTAWEKWLGTTLLDEFNRVEAIKGQKGSLSAVVERRQDVANVLEECPPRKWLTVEEFFRLLKVLAGDFHVARDAWRLYFCEQRYGSLGYDGKHNWELMEGRYALAFLFEYAATMGLIDVAYILPAGARPDFRDCWGTDELSCVSRYDGLRFFRINALGAWCLGLADSYEAEAVTAEPLLKVLPNLDVVASDRPLAPADVLFLDRFTERTSAAVWHLSAPRILAAVEEGLSVAELEQFLSAKSTEPVPQTVAVFLADLQQRTGQLRDQGTARLIECADASVMQLLAHDRRLRGLLHPAGDRQLVFRMADEAAVRRALRELGYVLPPMK